MRRRPGLRRWVVPVAVRRLYIHAVAVIYDDNGPVAVTVASQRREPDGTMIVDQQVNNPVRTTEEMHAAIDQVCAALHRAQDEGAALHARGQA